MTEFYVDKESLRAESTIFITGTGTGNLHSNDNQTHFSFSFFISFLRRDVFAEAPYLEPPGRLAARRLIPRKEHWEQGWPSCCASHPNIGSC